ncbi:uncharacterized protein LOC121387519 [Gigantopelta aegis]|uniref:uncharacterized protein LOC121387519 n=1 Tax=Gigantopelta aegis TaxID=1735272 RepID=UPI001B888924|nr:uncharacterized protein LOC121387519 [Gigantopelta aegis]
MKTASAILLCLSQKYRKSTENKTEAEFAEQSSKLLIPVVVEPGYKPDDWLSVMVGNKVLFDLSKPVLLDSGIIQLKEHLGEHGKLKQQLSVDYSGPVPENAAPLWLFSELQVCGNYLDYLPDYAGEEPNEFIMPCLSLPTASVINSRMHRMRNAVGQALFQNGGINYYGSPTVLLPQKLSPEDIDWPSQSLVHSQLNSHPLCYTRGDMSVVMTMSTQPLDHNRHIYWVAHLIDSEGFPYTVNMEAIEFPLLWAWHFILATTQQYHLSSYESIFANVKDLTHTKVSASITNFLHKMCMFLFIGLGSDFSEDYVTDFPLLDAAVTAMKSEMQDKLDQCGLSKAAHMFLENDIYLCKTHINAWNVSKHLTTAPTESFGQYAPFVRSVQIQGNQITSLPKELFTLLSNLLDLDASGNALTELPEEIGNCRLMGFLSVEQNKLTALPDTLANCKGLVRLNISSNIFPEMPACVTKLKKLVRLYAQNMQLMSLPEDIGNLEELTHLEIGGNCISRLPPSFTKLQSLTMLGMNGVAWCPLKSNILLSKEHFEDILKAYHLMAWLERHDQDKAAIFKFFDEDANGTLDPREIGKLNATIFYTFPRFGYMGADPPDDDTPHGFPEEILSLKKLEYLSLQYQAIVSLPADIEKLKYLSVLNLRHNPNLLSVPAQAGKLPLKRLELDECPLLKTPPKEIQAKGFATTFAYLQRLLSGSVECQRTKLMLVGLGGAGKTSLVKALLSGNHRTQLSLGEDITDGIDICPWSVFTEDGQVTYSVWDFAGQSVYYNTHQFFLSDRAVYMLLWNIRLGFEHAGLNFWLSSISVHAPNAPIFVVGSHVDQVAKVELPTKEMQERYPQIAGFHFVSSHTGQGVKELQDHLTEVTLRQQYMGERIPGVWLRFENSIASLKDRSVIEYKELEKRANNCGIFDQLEVFQAVQFLHELGSLQHFTNEYLKSYVVVNPQWIVDVMACVVSVKDSHIKDGRLHHDDIAKVWKDYPTNLHSWMLRLTEEFDLTFPLASEKTNLVPCLLPEKEPEINWPELDKNSVLREAKMVYKFDYLPAGLFNRGQVRLHQFSDSAMIWKRGSFLKKNKHICLIYQTRESELVVKAQGPRPENIVFLVHEVFENLIAESFQGVTYDYYLPCPDCMKLMLKDPHMFAASTVRRAKELKAPFLQCLKYFHTISLVTLQAQMPPSSSRDYDLHLVQAVQGLKELRKDLLTDIFISYCPKDIPSVQSSSKLTHPFKICKDLQAANYKCWFQKDSDKYSMDELIRALMDSSVVLVLISDAFVQDDDCCNLFKYACLTLKKPILLVVIGTGMQWKQSKLGILLADEVFVNMLQPERYDSKLKELLEMLKIRINKTEVKVEDKPPCFISYCWKNSAAAIALGSKSSEGSVGIGDPRKIKLFLEEKDVKCWIDVERIGLHGLFDDIAEGLLNAKVVVACVSDEYSASESCCREFRYAASTLKLPMILAVVGTGNKWRATEIGVLSLNYPLLSFQEKFDTPSEKLYDMVKAVLSSVEVKDSEKTKELKNKANEDQKNLSFQELYELAQRKFLRQVIHYADGQDTPYPYPRLFLVDLVQETTEEDESIKKSKTTESKMEEQVETKATYKFCVQILCEQDEGWHCCSEAIPLPLEPGSSPKEKFAPYLTRIMGIAKYSKKLLLQCMSTQAGQEYLKWLDESPQVAAASDFHQSYHNLRQEVIMADSGRVMGNLARCRLPNGKTTWLCEEHRSRMRVTVLSDEVVEAKRTATDSMAIDYMTLSMRDSEAMELSKKFAYLRPEHKVSSPTSSQTSVNDTKKEAQSPTISDGAVSETDKPTIESTSNSAVESPTRKPVIQPTPALRQLSRRSSSKTRNKSRACSIQ